MGVGGKVGWDSFGGFEFVLEQRGLNLCQTLKWK